MPDYRRKIGDTRWHWCSDCSEWPGKRVSVRLTTKDLHDEMCPMCAAMDAETVSMFR